MLYLKDFRFAQCIFVGSSCAVYRGKCRILSAVYILYKTTEPCTKVLWASILVQGSPAAWHVQNWGSKHLFTRLWCLEHFVHCTLTEKGRLIGASQSEQMFENPTIDSWKNPFFYTILLIWHILLVKCLKSALKWHNLQAYWPIFKNFVPIDIYLFPAIR